MIPLCSTDPGPRLGRRQFLQAGGAGALSLFVADWLRAGTASATHGRGKAKSVIMIYNCGAPSHTDLWDMKPDAPENIRGLFKPVATNVPGIQISELMPHMTRHADKFSIIRSVHHGHSSHNGGMYWSIVGRPYAKDSTLINPTRADLPSFGTLVGWLARRDGYNSPLPPYVITPEPSCDSTVYITPGQYGGCLGAKHDPLVLNTDPNTPNFRLPNVSLDPDMTPSRLGERRSLLGRLDGRSKKKTEAVNAEHGLNQDNAFSMITSPQVQKAFDLSQEPAKVRDRYGRHRWGQSHLLARRLVESGVKFVSTMNGRSIIWDTHKDNFNRMKTTLVPPMELAFSALLEDLEDRGMLDTTLVLWMSDFGRTPIINAEAGRDHWSQCYSVVIAGGGIRGGQIIGESDRTGAVPKSHPVSPADIHATVFEALGYDPQQNSYLTTEGRPYPLSEGEAIKGLL
ncbi:DUF1501 domain-containing protein [Zavarzinella formosa]|uniref:DUF1501 domain-containing protein n=1 Tax=Zavarzinella formosa TaxID=360055 RepID=UPI0002F8D9EF|nr:DUF1501 domain-containing protein [Zavarzinella formosa]